MTTSTRCFMCLAFAAGLFLTLGCAEAPQAPATPQVTNALVTQVASGSQLDAFAGTWDLTLDPSALTASLQPGTSRTGQGQGTTFDLDPAQFLKRDHLRIAAVEFDGAGDLMLTFIHKHPFGAPNFANPTTAKNRADLGYTGRLLILADLETSEVPSHTFFGDVVANTDLVRNADGYLQPGNLLHVSGFVTNCFPYVLLADEAKNNRLGVSNGGDMTGTYDAPIGGWQQANAGATSDGWTGFDYLHGGQTVTNQFTLNASKLGTGPIALQLAMLIKYTDPRGVPGFEHRFPTEPPNPIDFAYRLPYAALDASVIRVTDGSVGIFSTAGSTSLAVLTVRDWDAVATEAATSDLSAELDVSLIQQSASGAPIVEVSIPALNASTISISAIGGRSGEPGDELIYDGTVINALGTAPVGDAMGLIRATDPEAIDPNFSTYHFGVDPITILPDAARAILPITYQALPIMVIPVELPVVERVERPGNVGSPCDVVTFNAIATNSPTSWSWNFGGGASPNTSTAPLPQVTLLALGTYNGTVIATNAAGSSAPFPFSYTIATPALPSWSLHDSGGTTLSTVNQSDNTAIVAHNGGLAFCFVQGVTIQERKLMLAQTASSMPSASSDWTISEIDATGGRDPMLIRYNGTLAVAWYNNIESTLWVGFSTGPVPVSPGNWTKYALDDVALGNGSETGLAVIGGRLAVSYRGDTGQGVKFARAIDPQPVDASGWNIMSVDPSNDVGFDTDLEEINGVPMFTYRTIAQGDVRLARATSAIPTTTGNWTTSLIEASATSPGTNDLCQTSLVPLGNSRLGVMYGDREGKELTFGYSASLAPAGSADWTIYSVAPFGNWDGGNADMIMVAGRPVCSYMRHNTGATETQLRVARAQTCSPTSIADWVTTSVDPASGFGSSGVIGRFSSITEHNGTLTIAYLTSTFNWGIARSDGTW